MGPRRSIDHYSRIRNRLADELGVDAGADLRRLHQAILRGEPDPWSGSPAAVPPAAPPDAVPAQLPLDVYGFTGRSGELGQLDAILAGTGDQPTATAASRSEPRWCSTNRRSPRRHLEP